MELYSISVWLFSLNIEIFFHLRFVHVVHVSVIRFSFFCAKHSILGMYYSLFIHFLEGGCLECFQFFVRVCLLGFFFWQLCIKPLYTGFQVNISLYFAGSIPSCEVAGLHVSVFHFIRNCQLVFRVGTFCISIKKG